MARDLVKLSLLSYRDYEGYFASMHQSGNHWLRHILSMALAERFGLPEPENLHDMRLVGEPKCPTTYRGVPRLVFSHKICSPLVHNALTRQVVQFPHYVVMVRDLRSMLVSHYARFQGEYQQPFSRFLRGDITGKAYDCDIWDSIRFMNAWGRVVRKMPESTLVLRFEDLKANPVGQTRRVWRFLGLPRVDDSLLVQAVAASSKERMQEKEQRSMKTGTVIRRQQRNPLDEYSADDQRFLIEACRRHLRYDFGYDYNHFESLGVSDRIAA